MLPFALCSQEYQREGEVCPSVKSCSCQGCSQALAIWIQTQPEQLLLQPQRGPSSLSAQPKTPRTKRCTAQPEPFPAIPHSCLYSAYANILKASHRQGDALCRECNNTGPWTAWRMKVVAKGEAMGWNWLVYAHHWMARVCQAAVLELLRQECKLWLSCKVA